VKKILLMLLVVFLFLSSLTSAQQSVGDVKNTSEIESIKQKNPGEKDASKGFASLIYEQITEQPINLGILFFGFITLCLNIVCWLTALKRKGALIRKSEEFVADQPNMVMDTAFECFAGLQMNPYLRRFTRLAALIESIFKGTLTPRGGDDRRKNFYFAFVDILPLAGILGTLIAIALQASGAAGVNAAQSKANLGLAIFSTLLALGWTIVNKVLEGFWLHHFEYVENFREFFSVYQMSRETPEQNSIPAPRTNNMADNPHE